jgi:hypothetical protein
LLAVFLRYADRAIIAAQRVTPNALLAISRWITQKCLRKPVNRNRQAIVGVPALAS